MISHGQFILGERRQNPFTEHEARHKAAVMHDTWGHTAPKPREKHHGYILFAYGEYGVVCPIKLHFDGLDDSPWFMYDLDEFICDKSKNPGTIYRFDGYYMMQKNGKGRFVGNVKVVPMRGW